MQHLEAGAGASRCVAFDFDALVRLTHILAAAAWFGAGGFALIVIRPAVMESGPPGKAVLLEVLRRGGYGKWFGPAALLTVAAGAYLYIRQELYHDPFAGAASTLFTLGVASGLAAFVASLVGAVPIENKMKALAKQIPRGSPPNPEQAQQMERWGASLYRDNRIAMTLVAAAMVLMAGARIFA